MNKDRASEKKQNFCKLYSWRVVKVIEYKFCGELYLLNEICTLWLAHGVAISLIWKKCIHIYNIIFLSKCPKGINHPRSWIVFHKKSPPLDFIRKILARHIKDMNVVDRVCVV